MLFFFLLIQALYFSSEYLHSCSHTILYSQTQYSLRNKWDSPKLSWLLGIRSHDEADVCSESLEWSLWNHYLFACVGLNFSCHAKGFWWYLETLVVEWLLEEMRTEPCWKCLSLDKGERKAMTFYISRLEVALSMGASWLHQRVSLLRRAGSLLTSAAAMKPLVNS